MIEGAWLVWHSQWLREHPTICMHFWLLSATCYLLCMTSCGILHKIESISNIYYHYYRRRHCRRRRSFSIVGRWMNKTAMAAVIAAREKLFAFVWTSQEMSKVIKNHLIICIAVGSFINEGCERTKQNCNRKQKNNNNNNKNSKKLPNILSR